MGRLDCTARRPLAAGGGAGHDGGLGIYDLFSGQSQLGKLAFNQNRKESDLSYYSEAELNKLYGNKFEIKPYMNAADIKTDIKEGMQGSHYWRWLLWAALFFLLAEGIFIRFIKSH